MAKTFYEAFQAEVEGVAYSDRELNIAHRFFGAGWVAKENQAVEEATARASTTPKVHRSSYGLSYAVSQDVYWRYDVAPRSAKLFLLNPGGVAIIGTWIDNTGLLGWHPMFKRDISKEGKLR